MCNIAGYIGPRPAAQILCDMMRREAGFAGGYYTGLTTISGGELHTKKVLGDTDLLVSEARGDTLPGNIGIAHSRSRSGGDVRWGHPFVSNNGRVSYIANGAQGVFGDTPESLQALRALEADGVVFDSATPGVIGKYPHLSDGRCVHASEVMAHLTDYYRRTRDLPLCEALRACYDVRPAEIVSLAVSADEPDTISVIKRNKPVVIARTADEVFLASTAFAFPEDRDYLSITELPACTYGTVSLRETRLCRFASPVPVAPMTPELTARCYAAVTEALRNAAEPLSFGGVNKSVKDLWPAGMLHQIPSMTYAILYGMFRAGNLEVLYRDEPGAAEGADRNIRARRVYMKYIGS